MIDPTETAAPELAAAELLRQVRDELRAIRAAVDPPNPERRRVVVPDDGTEARMEAVYRSLTIVNGTGAALYVATQAGEAEAAAAGAAPSDATVIVAVGAILTVPVAGRAFYVAATNGALLAPTPVVAYTWHHVMAPVRS